MGQVRIQAPFKVPCLDRDCIQAHLHAGIPHVSDIVIITAVAKRKRHIEEEQHVRSLSVKILHRSGKASGEEIEIHSCIEVKISLPRNVRISL